VMEIDESELFTEPGELIVEDFAADGVERPVHNDFTIPAWGH